MAREGLPGASVGFAKQTTKRLHRLRTLLGRLLLQGSWPLYRLFGAECGKRMVWDRFLFSFPNVRITWAMPSRKRSVPVRKDYPVVCFFLQLLKPNAFSPTSPSIERVKLK